MLILRQKTRCVLEVEAMHDLCRLINVECYEAVTEKVEIWQISIDRGDVLALAFLGDRVK